MEAWDLLLFDLANFTLANNILDGMLSARTSGSESPCHIFLNLEVLLVYKISVGWLPIQVSGNVGLLGSWISKVLDGTLLVASEWGPEDVVSWISNVVLHSEPSIILEDIPISARSITLIVESWRILPWTWGAPFCNVTVIFLEMDSLMPHSNFVQLLQPSSILNYLSISACSVAPIRDMLGIKASLHRSKSLIRLSSTRMVHSFIFYLI